MARKRRPKKRDRSRGPRRAISYNVRALREQAGWTQAELAKRSGLGRFTIRCIEAGWVSNPTMDTLVKFARVFEVRTDVIIGLEPL